MTLTKEEKKKIAEIKKDLPQKLILLMTPEARNQLKEISTDPHFKGLEFQVKSTIVKLVHNPKYPGLNSHKFHGLTQMFQIDVWESYIQNHTPGAWRIFWHYGPEKNMLTVLMITAHP